MKVVITFLSSIFICQIGVCFNDDAEMDDIIELLKKDLNKKATDYGPTFVRWGRSDCPPTSEKVYNGFTAGAHRSQGGSGSNYLCLPENPQWGDYTAVPETKRGRLYGVEIESETNQPISLHLHNHDVTCAVCQTIDRKSVLMIPAMLTCPTDWNIEYNGYLVSAITSTASAHRGEYVCLDGSPFSATGANIDDNQAIVAPVEVRCGTLDCRKFPHNREVTCVVCSRRF